MKKILIAGDSITEGIIGFSYVKNLRQQTHDVEIINMGLGGDTLIGISNRLIEHLKTTEDSYDAIIIEAGHNDILLPEYENREGLFKATAIGLENRGSYPITDGTVFFNQYETTLKVVQNLTSDPLYITTLSCLNENPDSATMTLRNQYNVAIKKLALNNDVNLIDIGERFDTYLKHCETVDYLMNDYLRAFIIDSKMTKSHALLSHLSKERGLNLTIDGAHLNHAGCNLYTDAFIEALDLTEFLNDDLDMEDPNESLLDILRETIVKASDNPRKSEQ